MLIYAFAKNQSVKKGEILFIIDQSTYKAALNNAEASVASNRATMDLQQSNAARGHKLTKLSISAEQLETLDLQAKSASRRCGIEQDDIESAKRRNLVRWALPKVSEVAKLQRVDSSTSSNAEDSTSEKLFSRRARIPPINIARADGHISLRSLASEIASAIVAFERSISPKCHWQRAMVVRQVTTGRSTSSTGDCTPDRQI